MKAGRNKMHLHSCVAGAKRGGGGGLEKRDTLPFSLPPYPLPPSTPATQAR